ncbi:MAG TPA: carbohydrate-binding protein [Bacteroidales bacterium]|nr:carbohydrate-binding protein [Bacteroidales bacterium]
MIRFILLAVCLVFFQSPTYSQYMRASGKKILDNSGDEIILRGIGTGNWLLQEGYMMKSSEVAGTHTSFRNKLIETIGAERTDTFYQSWLDNHFTLTDVDSMKAWGFNSLRVAMHYKWLTLPIEDEPVAGQDTWLEEGFIRLDSLLDWCADNQMYLIFDLHGAPGGQGKDANISDYDSEKLSLWESSENRRKTVALWKKIAERYVNEIWVGGYDLINEPNWELPGGSLLKQLYVDITNAIREVDNNHMLIIEGNWFANDYTGLTPPWDDNIVYSFHKYWTYNTLNELNFILEIRNNYNVPIWLGESGENSNTWFTTLISLCEANQIGWSWWPVKKAGINNILQVAESPTYNNLMLYWKNGTPNFTADQAFNAVMDWSDNHRIENCMVKRDVIDAMIRQPHTDAAIPFRTYHPGEPVHVVNYDMGRSSSAYKDSDSANYHLNTNSYTNWNQGWEYRNDGVDIEKCNDSYAGGIGYSVGWTLTGEWLQYTIETDSAAAYTLTLRTASQEANPGIIRFTVDGTDVSGPINLPSTGAWNSWSSTSVNNIIIPEGNHKIRLIFERGGSNINLFSFTNPVAVTSVPFNYLYSETNASGNEIAITLNKQITSFLAQPGNFQVTVNGVQRSVTQVALDPNNSGKLVISLSSPVSYGQEVKISYQGNYIQSGALWLTAFTEKVVKNNRPSRITIPSSIEAEDYFINNGFQLENCTDIGGGKNIAFANNGDYLDYLINVPEAGNYQIMFRVASQYSNGVISIRVSTGAAYEIIGSLSVSNTGGWQTWTNQSVVVNLPAGEVTFRLYSAAGEYNINKFTFSSVTTVSESNPQEVFEIFPNPGNGHFKVRLSNERVENRELIVSDMTGRVVHKEYISVRGDEIHELNLSHLPRGIYHIHYNSGRGGIPRKVIIE